MKIKYLIERFADAKPFEHNPKPFDQFVEKKGNSTDTALRAYTTYSKGMNYGLLHKYDATSLKANVSPKNLQHINDLHHKARTMKVPSDIDHVYSGVSVNLPELWAHHGVHVNSPLRIHLRSFTSTSTSFEVACEFGTKYSLNNSTVNILKQFPSYENTIEDSTFYRNILVFENNEFLHGIPVDEVNGAFAGSEREIILPHSIDIIIEPTFTFVKGAGLTSYLIWDAKVLSHADDKNIQHDEFVSRKVINFRKANQLLTDMAETIKTMESFPSKNSFTNQFEEVANAIHPLSQEGYSPTGLEIIHAGKEFVFLLETMAKIKGLVSEDSPDAVEKFREELRQFFIECGINSEVFFMHNIAAGRGGHSKGHMPYIKVFKWVMNG